MEKVKTINILNKNHRPKNARQNKWLLSKWKKKKKKKKEKKKNEDKMTFKKRSKFPGQFIHYEAGKTQPNLDWETTPPALIGDDTRLAASGTRDVLAARRHPDVDDLHDTRGVDGGQHLQRQLGGGAGVGPDTQLEPLALA